MLRLQLQEVAFSINLHSPPPSFQRKIHQPQERRGRTKRAGFFSNLFTRRESSDNISLGSLRSGASSTPYLRRNTNSRNNLPGTIGTTLPATPGGGAQSPRRQPPQSDTLRGFRSFGGGRHPKQYTIASKEKYVSMRIRICHLDAGFGWCSIDVHVLFITSHFLAILSCQLC